MSGNKKVISKVIIVFLGITAFIAAIITYSDSMITSGITDLLEKAIIVESEFEQAHLNMLQGNISLLQLRVSNLEGSVPANFIVIDKIVVPVSIRELFEKKFVINNLEMDEVKINIDVNLLSQNYDNIFPVKPERDENMLEVDKRNIREQFFEVIINRVTINKIELTFNDFGRSKTTTAEKVSLNGPWNLHDDFGLGTMMKDIIESIGNDYIK